MSDGVKEGSWVVLMITTLDVPEVSFYFILNLFHLVELTEYKAP